MKKEMTLIYLNCMIQENVAKVKKDKWEAHNKE